MIEFLNLKQVNDPLTEELAAAATRIVRSGWYVLGAETEAFEREFADQCGARHCVGVANGLDAITLSLLALGIRPGDEVIVPSHTFVATWLAVSHAGATPVPVEVDPQTFNLDPSRVEAAVTPRTRAIVPVHLYGRPADLAPLLDIAARRGLHVVEDGAQAHGARYDGQRIGHHGDAVTWSFYPGKNLGALGDGGAITTDDDALAKRLRMLRNYGSTVKYHHEVIGFNSRLDEIQAAMLRVKLPTLDADNAHRTRIASIYLNAIDAPGVTLPAMTDGFDSSWHLFVVRHARRDRLAAELQQRGIGTLIHYPVAPHLQGAYASMGLARGSLPIAEALQNEVLSLPMGPRLTENDARTVASAVVDAARTLAAG